MVPGSLLFHYGRGLISRTISLATGYPWKLAPSHVSIICDYDGPEYSGLLLVESTTLNTVPCVINKERIRGVQAHQPVRRLSEYSGKIEIYDPDPMWTLSAEESKLLTTILIDHYVRKHTLYDRTGAIISGASLLHRLGCIPNAALHSVFCSELVYAVMMRMGRLPIRNPSAFSPAKVLKLIQKTGLWYKAGTKYNKQKDLTNTIRFSQQKRREIHARQTRQRPYSPPPPPPKT